MNEQAAILQYLEGEFGMELPSGRDLNRAISKWEWRFWKDDIDGEPLEIVVSPTFMQLFYEPFGKDSGAKIPIGFNEVGSDEFLDFLLSVKELIGNFYLSKSDVDMATEQ